MFVEFDESEFPIVRVIFHGRIKSPVDFENLIFMWEKYYERKRPFYFMFDTRDMGMMGLKYCFRMASFIKQLKRTQKVQYLQRSVILVKNRYIKFLLWVIFKTQKPVAPVYITNDVEVYELLHQNLDSGIPPPPLVEVINPSSKSSSISKVFE